MKHSATALLLTLSMTTAAAALAASSANAADVDQRAGIGKTQQFFANKDIRQNRVVEKVQKTDVAPTLNRENSLRIRIVDKEEDKEKTIAEPLVIKDKTQQIRVVDKEETVGSPTLDNDNSLRIRIVDKEEDKVKTVVAPLIIKDKTQQIRVVDKEQKNELPDVAPVANLNQSPENVSQETGPQESVQTTQKSDEQAAKETEKVDEDSFAPQTKTDTAKVEMPTVFTPEQIELFEKLGHGQQSSPVKKLIKKYGYKSMYPARIARKGYDGYSSQRYSQDDGYEYHRADRYYTQPNYHSHYHYGTSQGYRY